MTCRGGPREPAFQDDSGGKEALTFVDTPVCVAAFLIWISKMPSPKLVSVPVHDHCDTEAPGTRGADVVVSVWHLVLVIEGALPSPVKLNEMALVTEVHSMGVLYSSVMSTVVAFVSPLSAWIRAS